MDYTKGLALDEVGKRQKAYGKNEIKIEAKEPLWKKFLSQFTDLMVLILIAAAAVSIAIVLIEGGEGGHELIDAYVILGIVVLNGCIGFFQEYRSDKAIEALQKMIHPHCKVIRDGQQQEIDVRELVPGDVVVLAEGDKIPADGILFESNELKIDEAVLTGESVPVLKKENLNADTDAKKFENVSNDQKMFMGTLVTSGSGKALIVYTGLKTEFGNIAHLTATTKKDLSPLQKELNHISIFVGKVTAVIVTILFIVGVLVQGNSFTHALLFSVAVAVAAVPEGLPAVITIALALGVQRMARYNAIMKQLSSVETLGCTTVICSDKTGTLTKNEMTVKDIYLPQGFHAHFEGVGYEPKGEITYENNEEKSQGDYQRMMHILHFCNDAKLVEEGHTWKIIGDPTEGALLTAVQKSNIDITDHEVKKSFPFDSDRKRMSVIVQNDHQYAYVKGAPDAVLERCSYVLLNGEVTKLDDAIRASIMKQYNSMSDEALRVLAAAYKTIETIPDSSNATEQDLIFVGLVGMIDPPRPEVRDAVDLCHQAGIRTIIITGDYGKTAHAIAKQLNMAQEDTPLITGAELKEMNDQQLQQKLQSSREIIFARTTPENKMRIVDALKKLGEVVAVTGDGVNDAPALKRSDIGVAMGITGTDVSKEAANMVLTDDSFASIVYAVREGRVIYQNLSKFVWYLFSANIGELITIFIALVLNLPAPLTASLILAVNLGTDIFPALSLGVDPEEPGIMKQPPRDPKSKIMDKNFIMHIFCIGTYIAAMVTCLYLYQLYQGGWQWGEVFEPRSPVHLHAVTTAFATLVFIQLFNSLNARSRVYSLFQLRPNFKHYCAILFSGSIVVALIELPFFQQFLYTTGLTVADWFMVLGVCSSIFVVEELRKFIWRRKLKVS